MTDDPLKGCSHGKTLSERCIECELVTAREGERWAIESLTKYRNRIKQLETEGAGKNLAQAIGDITSTTERSSG